VDFVSVVMSTRDRGLSPDTPKWVTPFPSLQKKNYHHHHFELDQFVRRSTKHFQHKCKWGLRDYQILCPHDISTSKRNALMFIFVVIEIYACVVTVVLIVSSLQLKIKHKQQHKHKHKEKKVLIFLCLCCTVVHEDST
jgi:hypothetical protein